MFKRTYKLCLALALQACQSTPPYDKTVDFVDIDHYLGKWYVAASRPTMFETDAYNATETYTRNGKTGKIDVDFHYNKGAFDGPIKSMPQTAYVFDQKSNAHLKIGVWFLPFDLDYLIIMLDPAYQWTVVGVPNQKYLWVMSRSPSMSDEQLQYILAQVQTNGYSIANVKRVPQQEHQ